MANEKEFVKKKKLKIYFNVSVVRWRGFMGSNTSKYKPLLINFKMVNGSLDSEKLMRNFNNMHIVLKTKK